MFDIGFTELVLIGIVALIVIGPERLPAVAKTAGQWIAKVQRFVRGVKSDLASELDSGDLKKLIGDQREQIDELRGLVSSASKDFQSTASDVVEGAKKRMNEMETSINDDEAATPSESDSSKIASPEKNAGTTQATSGVAGSAAVVAGATVEHSDADDTPADPSKAGQADSAKDHSPTTTPPAGSSDMDRTGS